MDIYTEDFKVVEKNIINGNIDINDRDENGIPIIIKAIKLRRDDILTVLLENGADINATMNDGSTALMVAVDENNMHAFDLLLKYDKILNGDAISNVTGGTVLHKAAKIGNVDIIAKLLYICKTDIQDFEGYTPFHTAYYNKRINAAKMLIPYSNVNIPNRKGSYCMDLAIVRKDYIMVRELIKTNAYIDNNYGEFNVLFHVIRDNFVDFVDICIQYGANINQSIDGGKTPLYYAIENRNINLVAKLIANGANPNKLTSSGDNLLYFAVWYNSQDIINILIAAGGDLDHKNNRGISARDLANSLSININ